MAELGGTQTLEPASGKLPFGVRLLATPAGVTGARWEPAAVEAMIEKAATTADYVVIDATPAHPEMLQAAVGRAWFTLVVVEREPISVQLGARTCQTLSSWANRPNAVGAALVNHMPFMDAAPLPAIRAELNCGVVGVPPPAREILHSYRRQEPIVVA